MKNHLINRKINILLIVISLFFNSCKSKKIPKVDIIWEKYLQTVASRETVSNIKTSYKVTDTKSKKGIIRTIHTIKAPDKILSEVIFPNKTKIFVIMNGKKGVVKRNGKIIHQMDKNELKMNSELALIFPEYIYTSKNNDIEYNGVVKENGKEYYKIKINRWSDENVYYLIDNKTFEFYKMISDNGIVFEVIEIKKNMGVNTFWTTRNIKEKDTIINQVIENKYNIKLNDTIFKLD